MPGFTIEKQLAIFYEHVCITRLKDLQNTIYTLPSTFHHITCICSHSTPPSSLFFVTESIVHDDGDRQAVVVIVRYYVPFIAEGREDGIANEAELHSQCLPRVPLP